MNFFNDDHCLIIPNVLGKSKAELFHRKLKEFGGKAVIFNPGSRARSQDLLESVNHVIVDPGLQHDKLAKILGITVEECEQLSVVSCRWLSRCLDSKARVDITEFIIKPPSASPSVSKISDSSELERSPSPKRRKDYSSKLPQLDAAQSFDSQQENPLNVETTPPSELPGSSVSGVRIKKDAFICMKSSKAESAVTTSLLPNQDIIDKLEEMAAAYKSTKDKWRVFSYEKAIIALKTCKERIDSYEKALRLPNVGKSLAEKIFEIAESGGLQKLDNLQSSDLLRSVQLFMRIWGVGAETANVWASQGLKTLDDVRQRAKLNANQKIGLQYFDEFDERMCREEVSQIEAVVKTAVEELDPGLELTTCGSYRRGKSTCGDVDILITHPDGRSHIGVFSNLLHKLHDQGFLTDDLTVQPNMTGGMAKYLGVCRLPAEGSKHRRIDIIVTPYSQYGCALVYFTGSAHFNRSMRLMADKMGLSLTEHALYKDVIRQNKEIIHHGVIVKTPTERSVFDYLGIPYRPPEERDHS